MGFVGSSVGLFDPLHVRDQQGSIRVRFSFFCINRMLSISAPEDQKAMVFAGVFVLVWIGAAIVTLNAQLLGGTM